MPPRRKNADIPASRARCFLPRTPRFTENIVRRPLLLLRLALHAAQRVRITDDRRHRRFQLVRERGHKVLALAHRQLQRIYLFLHGGRHGVKASAQHADLVPARKARAFAVRAARNAFARLCQTRQRFCQPAGQQRDHRARAHQHHQFHFPEAQQRTVPRGEHAGHVVSRQQRDGRIAHGFHLRLEQHIRPAAVPVHAVSIRLARRALVPGKRGIHRAQRRGLPLCIGSRLCFCFRFRLRRGGGRPALCRRVTAVQGHQLSAHIILQRAAVARQMAVRHGLAPRGHVQQVGFQRIALQQMLHLRLLARLVQSIVEVSGQYHRAPQRERHGQHQKHGQRQLLGQAQCTERLSGAACRAGRAAFRRLRARPPGAGALFFFHGSPSISRRYPTL